MNEVVDQINVRFAYLIGCARDDAARRVLSEMLPRDRFSVVAADEINFINDRIEYPDGFNGYRWVCDGVSVEGARVLL